MESTIQGRVYKFGDNVNSDIIIPGRYLIYIDRERLAQPAPRTSPPNAIWDFSPTAELRRALYVF